MNLREIEEGGLRFYEAKGRAAGECDDAPEPTDDYDEDYDPGFCDGCDCPLTPDVECGLCVSCCGTDDEPLTLRTWCGRYHLHGPHDNCLGWGDGRVGTDA